MSTHSSGKVNQSYEKIKNFIKKSNVQERLEFTQGIINFAHKIDRKFLIEGLLPNLETLVGLISCLIAFLGDREDPGYKDRTARSVHTDHRVHW